METKTLCSLLFQYFILTYYVMGFTNEREKKVLLNGEQDVLSIVTALQAKVTALETEVSNLKSNSNSGSVYVRWGRTSCPGNGTELVYNGQMAGNKWDNKGGGSNSVCLPNDPTWGEYIDGMNTGGVVYGTEIEIPDTLASSLFGKPAQDENIPCSVCRTVRSSSVMIPGRANCYPGWTMEYKGYVVSGGASYNSVDYACLDAGLEFSVHGAANDDEHILYVVEAHCGSLACPPYVSGRELACVVCSK